MRSRSLFKPSSLFIVDRPRKETVYSGLSHAFWIVFLDSEVSQKYTSETTCGLTWLFAE